MRQSATNREAVCGDAIPRHVGVVTVARSDYGILRSLIARLSDDPRVHLSLYVTGMHLAPEFGGTVAEIEADGVPIAERIEMLMASEGPQATALSMGNGVAGFARVFGRRAPDVLVLLGDRFEMLAPAVAALPFNIIVAHIHGGEITEASFDNTIRHAITKLSHLHFTSTEAARQRLLQMGEEPTRVLRSGAPALDRVAAFMPGSPAKFEAQFGVPLSEKLIICTYHPETLDLNGTLPALEELLGALERVGHPILFTASNADPLGRAINNRISEYVSSHQDAWLVESLGAYWYFTALSHCAALVGNSSSGIIEAASFGVPVVNVGARQAGRERGANVVDTSARCSEIVAAVEKVLDPVFRHSIQGIINPYATGKAVDLIQEVIATTSLDGLRRKTFFEFYDRRD